MEQKRQLEILINGNYKKNLIIGGCSSITGGEFLGDENHKCDVQRSISSIICFTPSH